MKHTDSSFSLHAKPSSFAFPSLVQTSLDIGRVLGHLGGGGHAQAAGFTLHAGIL
jgi:nanoRNase/pAp phosphatase (c-di-AMP/oligoRNAs hydrolase)